MLNNQSQKLYRKHSSTLKMHVPKLFWILLHNYFTVLNKATNPDNFASIETVLCLRLIPNTSKKVRNDLSDNFFGNNNYGHKFWNISTTKVEQYRNSYQFLPLPVSPRSLCKWLLCAMPQVTDHFVQDEQWRIYFCKFIVI